jgi:hypothetical protein
MMDKHNNVIRTKTRTLQTTTREKHRDRSKCRPWQFTCVGDMFNPLLQMKKQQDADRLRVKKDLEAILAAIQHVSPSATRGVNVPCVCTAALASSR